MANKTLYVVLDDMTDSYGDMAEPKVSLFDSKTTVKAYLKKFQKRDEHYCEDYEKEYVWTSFCEAFKKSPSSEEKCWTYWSEDFYHSVYPVRMNDMSAFEA